MEEFVRIVMVNDGVVGLEVRLPDAPPLILVRGRKGFVMCGYLDIGVAEKLGLKAARVTGVGCVEDLLEKEIAEVTSRAREAGIKEGVKVKDVIDKL